MSIGAVPVPESLLFSPPPAAPLRSISSQLLLDSVGPAELDDLRRTCRGAVQCVHDILASGSTELGLHTLEAKTQHRLLAVIHGEAPIVRLQWVHAGLSRTGLEKQGCLLSGVIFY